MTRVLGLDIGGSSSRAQVWDGDTLLAESAGPSASVAAAGLERATVVLDDVLGRLGGAGQGVAAAVAGVAGVGVNPTRALYTDRLERLTGSGRVGVVEDVHLLLPAAGLHEGVALVAGTGSCAAGEWDGHLAKVGGWGYLLGDDGSGYWLVREAARVVLARLDRGDPPGLLGQALFAALGVPEPELLRDRLFADARPQVWAAAVPAVLGSGDPAVESLAEQTVGHWLALVGQVRRRLGAVGPLPVVPAGGLVGDERLHAGLVAGVEASFPGSAVVTTPGLPVRGAVELARRLALT